MITIMRSVKVRSNNNNDDNNNDDDDGDDDNNNGHFYQNLGHNAPCQKKPKNV